SPGSISYSLLITAHPHLLQQMWVRASSACYRTFTLAMTRSPGFGSTACDYAPCSDSVSLRLPYTVKLATDSKSLTHYTKGTQSPRRAPAACTHTVSGSISLPSPGFCSPFHHGTASLSVGQECLAFEDAHLMFGQIFSGPAPRPYHGHGPFAYRAVPLCGRPFPAVSAEPWALLG